jgi:hypothetical protein
MPTIASRLFGASRAGATQWPSDPTAELDFDQFLGLRDTPDRPPFPRARMTLFRGGSRTVALTEGWRSYPPIVDVLPGPSTPPDSTEKSRKPRKRTALRSREIVSTPAPTVSNSVDDEELLTTQAAAAYCGYLDGVSLRKAKFDGLLEPVRVGTNRSYLWRRSDLDAHNRRRGFVPRDAQSVPEVAAQGGGIAAGESISPTELPPPADPSPPLVDAGPEVTSPVVEPIAVSASAPSTPIDVSAEVLATAEGPGPTAAVLDPVESEPAASNPLAERIDRSSSTPTSAPTTHDSEEHTATDSSAAVTPPAWRRRPLAAILRLFLPWGILATASGSSGRRTSPATPAGSVSLTPRCETSVPYRGDPRAAATSCRTMTQSSCVMGLCEGSLCRENRPLLPRSRNPKGDDQPPWQARCEEEQLPMLRL